MQGLMGEKKGICDTTRGVVMGGGGVGGGGPGALASRHINDQSAKLPFHKIKGLYKIVLRCSGNVP